MAFGMPDMPRRHTSLVALFNWIPLAGPIRAEVVGKIEYLHIGKTHVAQFRERRPKVRTTIPGTAAAIKHNELFSRKRVHPILQLLDSCWL
jgi:hypothetical protein